METAVNWDNYLPGFRPYEFTCRCGCGLNNMQAEFMKKLTMARQIARETSNIPFIITSGCRCAVHNRKEGGSSSSDHLTGRGADIRCKSTGDRWIIIDALIKAGFNRIGIAKTFIHAGDEPKNTPNVIWLY